jgi:hypothetical protein
LNSILVLALSIMLRVLVLFPTGVVLYDDDS